MKCLHDRGTPCMHVERTNFQKAQKKMEERMPPFEEIDENHFFVLLSGHSNESQGTYICFFPGSFSTMKYSRELSGRHCLSLCRVWALQPDPVRKMRSPDANNSVPTLEASSTLKKSCDPSKPDVNHSCFFRDPSWLFPFLNLYHEKHLGQ